MALLNSFGASNQMLESPLKITTSRVQIGNRDGLPIFENHRFAKKEWSWVGMSEATARACVRYVQKKYTRTFKQLYDEAGNQVSTEMTICVADASCSRSGEGSMWNVGVSLDEEQVQYTLGNNEPLWDDSCDYDEMPVKGAYLRMYNLAKASDGETVSFNYDQIITGFNFAALEIEAAPTASGEWVSVKNYIRTRKAPSADYGEGGNIGVWIPPGNAYIRIRWGNALATEDRKSVV